MAARRGKSQARRNNGSSGGLPGWAWMILGIVLALGAVLLAPKLLKGDGAGDAFFRPQPNPDAQPPVSAIDEAPVPADDRVAPPAPAARAPAPATEPEYDFYTVLPAQEVAMSDAELAASARAEAERQRRARQQAEQARQAAGQPHPDAADPAPARTAATTPPVAPPAARQDAPPVAPARTATAPAAAVDNTRYLLQAGAFKASGDAESLKARIALLGLQARVESGTANGETVYRVRMGPYGSATELAEAKQKLGNGGLPAMAIKAN